MFSFLFFFFFDDAILLRDFFMVESDVEGRDRNFVNLRQRIYLKKKKNY